MPHSKNDLPSSLPTEAPQQRRPSLSIEEVAALVATIVRTSTVSSSGSLGENQRRQQSRSSKPRMTGPDLKLLLEEALSLSEEGSFGFEDNAQHRL
jgi:hypothetical protein